MSSLNVNICIPDFCYDVEVGERRACAQAIAREIEFSADDLHGYQIDRMEVRNVCTVADKDIEHVFAVALRSMDLSGAYRVADIAPEQLNTGLLTSLRNFRIDMYRIDLGSLNPTDFHNLGRGYDTSVHGILAKVLDAYRMDNWCAELDLGIKGQHLSTVDDCLDKLLTLAPGAVTVRTDLVEEESADQAAELFGHMGEVLEKAGMARVSANSFALPGFERAFAVADGEPPEYWGFGPGALSYMDGCVLGIVPQVASYIALMRRDIPPTPGVMRLDAATRARNFIVHGLEGVAGVDLETLASSYGKLYDGAVEELVEQGLAQRREGRLVATTRGVVLNKLVRRKLEGTAAR